MFKVLNYTVSYCFGSVCRLYLYVTKTCNIALCNHSRPLVVIHSLWNAVFTLLQTVAQSCNASARSVWTGKDSLAEDDPEVHGIITQEKHRQIYGLELIASEVYSK